MKDNTKMDRLIDNYINGNLTDAKRQADAEHTERASR